MATETATASLLAIEVEKSTTPSVSPSIAQGGLTTPSNKASRTPLSSSSTTSSSIAATASNSSITVSNTDLPVESPSPKRNELPKIIVKKEPTSPEPPSRHRPPKLHLSNDADSGPTVPRTAGGNLSTMRDVGMACLSPGFATHDPTMREQLQRSISVRDQQRSIIEARLQRHAKPGGGKDNSNEPASARAGSSHTPKRRPPNSLTIVPPPHRAFANERVVQSAPLNQSFTGRHHASSVHPPPQHTHNPQNVNRLPPLSDVFASERLDSGARTSRPVDPPQTSRHYYPAPRPSQPSPNSLSYSRPREHRSAEEALQLISGGREDLLPRIIHYGGHQPPTPPSPPQVNHHTPSKLGVNGEYQPPQSAGRRRNRSEYERDNDNFGLGSRDSPETKRQKKEEFLSLCSRAWELFHS